MKTLRDKKSIGHLKRPPSKKMRADNKFKITRRGGGVKWHTG
jgi:hypothetical protein